MNRRSQGVMGGGNERPHHVDEAYADDKPGEPVFSTAEPHSHHTR